MAFHFAERGVEVAALEWASWTLRRHQHCLADGEHHYKHLTSTTGAFWADGISHPGREAGDHETGVPLFVGALKPKLAVVHERGDWMWVSGLWLDDIGSATIAGESLGGLEVDVRTTRADYGRLRVPFPGSHQAANCLLSVGAGELLVPTLSHVREGIEQAFIAGRFQVIERAGRTFVLDIAHNEEALRVTAAHIAEFAPREDVLLIFGLLRRKELFDAPVHLLKAAGALCLVEPESEPGSTDTAFAPHELLQHFFLRHLPDASTDVILWNRRDERDDSLARLAERLERPGERHLW